jgi:hypothetical protein
MAGHENTEEKMTDQPFVTCLWFDTEAEAAATFYTLEKAYASD